jgi:hypothetical protein
MTKNRGNRSIERVSRGQITPYHPNTQHSLLLSTREIKRKKERQTGERNE